MIKGIMATPAARKHTGPEFPPETQFEVQEQLLQRQAEWVVCVCGKRLLADNPYNIRTHVSHCQHYMRAGHVVMPRPPGQASIMRWVVRTPPSQQQDPDTAAQVNTASAAVPMPRQDACNQHSQQPVYIKAEEVEVPDMPHFASPAVEPRATQRQQQRACTQGTQTPAAAPGPASRLVPTPPARQHWRRPEECKYAEVEQKLKRKGVGIITLAEATVWLQHKGLGVPLGPAHAARRHAHQLILQHRSGRL